MGLLSTSDEMVVVQKTQVTTTSSYTMEIYQQKFVLLVLCVIFAGGSYLNITMSHAVGVTDFYLSIWAVVDATK